MMASIKNVLITGGAGFIGSHVTIDFVKKYPSYSFIVVDNMSYCSNVKNLKSIENSSNYTFIDGSITSQDLMRHIFNVYDINTVIHFAAESHIDLSFDNADKFVKTNILGTQILLECARQKRAIRNSRFDLFVHISTDEVYGESSMQDQYKDAKKETDVLLPTNPYAGSKAAAEMIVHSYWKSYKLPVIITRSCNVYGPHQFPEKLIPQIICLIDRGKHICLHGHGKNTRFYIHVKDLVNAFDLIIHNGKIGEIYNITSNDEHNPIEVVNKILKCFKNIPKENYDNYIRFGIDRAYNDSRYYMNGDKLDKLGWKQSVSFENGLKKTVEWYLEHKMHWINIENVLVPHPKSRPITNKIYGGHTSKL